MVYFVPYDLLKEMIAQNYNFLLIIRKLETYVIFAGEDKINILAAACAFQQCGILTSADSDEPVQPPFKLRNSK